MNRRGFIGKAFASVAALFGLDAVVVRLTGQTIKYNGVWLNVDKIRHEYQKHYIGCRYVAIVTSQKQSSTSQSLPEIGDLS